MFNFEEGFGELVPLPAVQALVRAMPWVNGLMRLASPFKDGSVNGRPLKSVARLDLVVDALSARLA